MYPAAAAVPTWVIAAQRPTSVTGREEVGGSVGYRMRLDSRISRATRIEVVTEGVFTRLIQADPALILSQNYVSHLMVYRRSLIERAGGFRLGFEGSQDHECDQSPVNQAEARGYAMRFFQGSLRPIHVVSPGSP